MNKAKNLDEFTDAMSMMALTMFNTVYADKSGNIFYVYNSIKPKISMIAYNHTEHVHANQGRVQEFAWGGCEAPRKFSTPPTKFSTPPVTMLTGGV